MEKIFYALSAGSVVEIWADEAGSCAAVVLSAADGAGVAGACSAISAGACGAGTDASLLVLAELAGSAEFAGTSAAGAGGLDAAGGAESGSAMEFIARLKAPRLSPMDLPISGSFLGPKSSSATMAISMSSPGPIPKGMVLFPL